MYILHIETSTRICSVALSLNQALVEYLDMPDCMNHAAMLAPAIDQILQSTTIKPEDLSAISVSSGPGSYTGLRVGSSTAKGMAYSLGIPIIAVPTLLALARAVSGRHPDAEYALPMLDARRKEVYTALYDQGGREIWPVTSVVLDASSFRNMIPDNGIVYSCGDGALKIGELASEISNLRVDTEIQCSARHLIAPALERYLGGMISNPLSFVPFYLKPPNITQPRKTWPGPA